MRFLEDGADIPDELIRSTSDGDAVFLCGAGVSMRVDMPSFKKLTDDIYAELGETRTNEPAERIAYERMEFDRALRSLEKRTHFPNAPWHVRAAATKLLTAKVGVDTRHHLALLHLSRDRDGRPRLLTTNFDTLFERAARAGGLTDVPSHTSKALPKPGGPVDYGIMHLHGRIRDDHLSLLPSDLVLTSADFGDAYLRDGWASQYIEDRMRLNTLVLVGYRAEDAALRLLLETLDADRDRFRDLKDIYAIEKRSDDSASIWKAKGIKPIEFAEYDAIYATLAEWARYALKPAEYGRDRIQAILIDSPATHVDVGTMTAETPKRKKTPRDASEFEREQLRFFLTRDDITAALENINPSIAWLPWLAEMKLLQPSAQLAPWIEKSFVDPDGIRDVAANIHYFDANTAELLEFRLNRQLDTLSPGLVKCWRLIIRHMRSARRGVLARDWFDIAPRVKRGEQSPEVLYRLSEALKPKLKIAKRIAWDEERRDAPQAPTDLMSIDYEIEMGLNHEEVLSVWPSDAPSEIEDRLLRTLTTALGAALDDAIDAGVESSQGYGISDGDVPSVAAHEQNAYRTGFQPIVRVMAEIWTRLATKDAARALRIVELWRQSGFRPMRRLALFTAANPVVPASTVAGILMALPQGELFLTNSTVEVYRLLQQRWHGLAPEQRQAIEERIIEGPPTDWFNEGVETQRIVDRCRFDLLGHLQRAKLVLTKKSEALFKQIVERWPEWQLGPAEQAGFHAWHESTSGIVGDPDKLKGVPEDDLVAAAEKAAAEADFLEGDAWQALCQSDPARALRGLEAQANKRLWSAWAWKPFLWAGQKIEEPESTAKIARLLLAAPDEPFAKIASSASWWLNEKARRLEDRLLWPLWDRIADSVLSHAEETEDA
jgi:SIR2-like domain